MHIPNQRSVSDVPSPLTKEPFTGGGAIEGIHKEITPGGLNQTMRALILLSHHRLTRWELREDPPLTLQVEIHDEGTIRLYRHFESCAGSSSFIEVMTSLQHRRLYGLND
jgi:hypothetical protein